MAPSDLQNPKRMLEDSTRAKSMYTVIPCDEFVTLDIPPQEYVLSPWLPKQGLAMIYADRGIGKTFFALEIALSVALGTRFLNWEAPEKRRVLYLDGEMQLNQLQDRIKQLVSHHNNWSPRNLHLMPCGAQAQGMPDLSLRKSQELLNPYVDEADLIVIDNISTLCRTGAENEAESWIPVQEFLLRLRADGKTVLLVHHAGKGGSQRGTSKREDVLDTVIHLKRPETYTAEQGARFEVNFEKARNFAGEEAQTQIVQLVNTATGLDWQSDGPKETTYEKVVKQLNLGASQAETAQHIGISTSGVSRHAQRARQAGLLINLST